MKKTSLLYVLLASSAVSMLASCAAQVGWKDDVVRIVMLTSYGPVEDKSFNEGTWRGLQTWGKANGFTENINGNASGVNSYGYIQSSSMDTSGYEKAIGEAYRQGADVVICPGYLFQEAAENMTVTYPDMAFVCIDILQENIAETPNSINFSFKEQDAGFLAGYAAVAEGIETLGFMGGQLVPAVQRYGMGYAAGIAYANKALNKSATIVENAFRYTGTFLERPEERTWAAGHYENNVQVIFACAGTAGNSVLKAASEYKSLLPDGPEKDKVWAIGVDVDQGAQPGNEIILTSAIKGLGSAIGQALDTVVNEDKNGLIGTYETDAEGNRTKFSPKPGWGGTSRVLGSAENAAGIPTEESSWRFKNFTLEQYDEITNLLKDRQIVVPGTESEELANPSVLTGWIAENGRLENAGAIAGILYGK